MSENAHAVTKEGNTSLPGCPGRRSTRLWPEGPTFTTSNGHKTACQGQKQYSDEDLTNDESTLR